MRFDFRIVAAGCALFTVTAAGPLTRPSPPVQDRPAAGTAPLTPDEIYSRRALRRARLLIQMRVLELREERLACVERAIRRNLPSVLLVPGGKDNAVKPSDSPGAISLGTRLLAESETCAWISDRPPPRKRTA
jgi:hypothetical protein